MTKMQWTPMTTRTTADLSLVFEGNTDEVVAQVEALGVSRGLALQVEVETDQITAYTVSASGRRRRFLTLMP